MHWTPPLFRPLRRPRRHRGRPALLACAALLGALLAVGCGKNEDVARLEQNNRVQDQRLRALEESIGAALRKLTADLQDVRKVLDGRGALLEEQLKQLAAEQARLLGAGELTQAQLKRLERHVEEHLKVYAQYRADAESETDKLRLRMKDVEALMRSPIAQLPATTEGDKAFREATFLLINGQMDVAADKFGQFAQRFAKDPRRIEALLRQGQAYFLLRQYDHALVPLFEVVEKNSQHRAAQEARWLLARALEETGDLKLARDFYAQLVSSKSEYSADASRRVALMNRMLPGGAGKAAPPPAPDAKPGKADPAPPPAAQEADDEEEAAEEAKAEPAGKASKAAAKQAKAAPAKVAKKAAKASKAAEVEKPEPPAKPPPGAGKSGKAAKAGKAAKQDPGDE